MKAGKFEKGEGCILWGYNACHVGNCDGCVYFKKNQKTVEEVEKALEYCIEWGCDINCPYYDNKPRCDEMKKDALAHIRCLRHLSKLFDGEKKKDKL